MNLKIAIIIAIHAIVLIPDINCYYDDDYEDQKDEDDYDYGPHRRYIREYAAARTSKSSPKGARKLRFGLTAQAAASVSIGASGSAKGSRSGSGGGGGGGKFASRSGGAHGSSIGGVYGGGSGGAYGGSSGGSSAKFEGAEELEGEGEESIKISHNKKISSAAGVGADAGANANANEQESEEAEFAHSRQIKIAALEKQIHIERQRQQSSDTNARRSQAARKRVSRKPSARKPTTRKAKSFSHFDEDYENDDYDEYEDQRRHKRPRNLGLTPERYQKHPPHIQAQVDEARRKPKTPRVPEGMELVEMGDETEVVAIEQEPEEVEFAHSRQVEIAALEKQRHIERSRNQDSLASALQIGSRGSYGGSSGRYVSGSSGGSPGGKRYVSGGQESQLIAVEEERLQAEFGQRRQIEIEAQLNQNARQPRNPSPPPTPPPTHTQVILPANSGEGRRGSYEEEDEFAESQANQSAKSGRKKKKVHSFASFDDEDDEEDEEEEPYRRRGHHRGRGGHYQRRRGHPGHHARRGYQTRYYLSA